MIIPIGCAQWALVDPRDLIRVDEAPPPVPNNLCVDGGGWRKTIGKTTGKTMGKSVKRWGEVNFEAKNGRSSTKDAGLNGIEARKEVKMKVSEW